MTDDELRRIVSILLERVETLENQVFAQRLFNDELERTLEELKKKKDESWFTPTYISTPNAVQQVQQYCLHMYPATPDTSGQYHCTLCGMALVGGSVITWSSSIPPK